MDLVQKDFDSSYQLDYENNAPVCQGLRLWKWDHRPLLRFPFSALSFDNIMVVLNLILKILPGSASGSFYRSYNDVT